MILCDGRFTYISKNLVSSARMREGYCSSPVCLSVCLSVYPSIPTLAASVSVETSKQRYSRVSLRLFLD